VSLAVSFPTVVLAVTTAGPAVFEQRLVFATPACVVTKIIVGPFCPNVPKFVENVTLVTTITPFEVTAA